MTEFLIELGFLLRQKAIFQTSILIKNAKIKINSDDYLQSHLLSLFLIKIIIIIIIKHFQKKVHINNI